MSSYRYAHDRVRAQRGNARDHACVDCGEPATEWSYRNFCDDERIGPESLAFCYHAEHYDPRCRTCHVRLDHSGERHHGAKLTEEQVVAIRTQYASGVVTLDSLAEAYGVAKQTISRAVRGDLWAQAGGPLSIANSHRSGKGEGHARAKLTCADVRDIRRRHGVGEETQRALAAEYGVSSQLISQIVHGLIWKSCE